MGIKNMEYKSHIVDFKKVVNGEDAAIKSDIEPSDKNKLWLDTSFSPPLLKYYDFENEQWKIVNNNDEKFEEIITRLNNAEIFINNAEGTVTSICEETIQKEIEGRVESIENKTSNIKQTAESWTATFKYIKDGVDKTSSFQLSSEGAKFGEMNSDSYTSMGQDKFAVVIEDQEVASIDKSALKVDEINVRKRFRIGDVILIETDNGYEEMWGGD